ncbi:hypothetical protein FHX81_0405 [Saccharothrix saharensis]|uniref:Uncharacterized protein n=1 Tax=Saccharothrix saharensis TaxID=571190 RepID=A0A543J5N7_9PSEU|nr:hypothetical protein [Saccharothrix saharensis]TQM78154.1 hypothetical protein FHX81_0405 [Saccharothrix saharensis]
MPKRPRKKRRARVQRTRRTQQHRRTIAAVKTNSTPFKARESLATIRAAAARLSAKWQPTLHWMFRLVRLYSQVKNGDYTVFDLFT